VRRTQASLDLGGWARWPGPRLTIVDSDLEGQAKTFFAAMRVAAACPDFSALTLFEDDVVVSRNALDYISQVVVDPDIALVSWFCRRGQLTDTTVPHLEIGGTKDFAYNQAITMPAATVRALVDSEAARTWPGLHGADTLVGKVMTDGKVAYHFPNLADHVDGGKSLVGSFGRRKSSTFLGENADALALS
jgi:hypothetical protein